MRIPSFTIWLFTLLLALTLPAAGQKLSVVSVSHQRWAGGIAGHHGDRYTFRLKMEGTKMVPSPDTLLMNSAAFPMVDKSKDPSAGNFKMERKGKFCLLTISTEFSYIDEYPGEQQRKQPEAETKAPIKFKGIALLKYRCNGHVLYCTIRSITEEMPQLNYP